MFDFISQRKHQAMYIKYTAEKKDSKKPQMSKQRSTKRSIDQDELDQIVIKYIINGIQPLRSVEDESFKEYTYSKYKQICALNDISFVWI